MGKKVAKSYTLGRMKVAGEAIVICRTKCAYTTCYHSSPHLELDWCNDGSRKIVAEMVGKGSCSCKPATDTEIVVYKLSGRHEHLEDQGDTRMKISHKAIRTGYRIT